MINLLSFNEFTIRSFNESLDPYLDSSRKFKVGERVIVKGRHGKITAFNGKDYLVLVNNKNQRIPESQIERLEPKKTSRKKRIKTNERLETIGDYGYHAGNLAHKSGTLSRTNFMPTLRSQLGTGYYFFGDLRDAENLAGVKKQDTRRADQLTGTTIYRIDFSKYNTFSPGERAYEYYHDLVIPAARVLNSISIDDLTDPEIIEGLEDIADYYRDFNIQISNSDFVNIVKEYLMDIGNRESQSDELINTRVMKAAGYEGIDFRNTEKDGIVDGKASVGSVIFDLKPGTIDKI
jgi:hypothetical protein